MNNEPKDELGSPLPSRETLKALLRRLEWSKSYSYCTGWPCCPICGGIKPGHGRDEDGSLPDNQGHRADCTLAEAIAVTNDRLSVLLNKASGE